MFYPHSDLMNCNMQQQQPNQVVPIPYQQQQQQQYQQQQQQQQQQQHQQQQNWMSGIWDQGYQGGHNYRMSNPVLGGTQQPHYPMSHQYPATAPFSSAPPPPQGNTQSSNNNGNIELLACAWMPPNVLGIPCGAVMSLEEMVVHLKDVHLQGPEKNDHVCYWKDCTRKLKMFKAKYKLKNHLRVHTGEKPFTCAFHSAPHFCSMTFARNENRKIHQRVHTGKRPFACKHDGCEKKFANSSDRKKHHQIHIKTKKYKCEYPECKKVYTHPSSLRKHKKMNHTPSTGEEPPTIGQRFATRARTQSQVNFSQNVAAAASIPQASYNPVGHSNEMNQHKPCTMGHVPIEYSPVDDTTGTQYNNQMSGPSPQYNAEIELQLIIDTVIEDTEAPYKYFGIDTPTHPAVTTMAPTQAAHYSGTTSTDGVQMNTNTLATSKPMQPNYGNQLSGHNMQNGKMQQSLSNPGPQLASALSTNSPSGTHAMSIPTNGNDVQINNGPVATSNSMPPNYGIQTITNTMQNGSIPQATIVQQHNTEFQMSAPVMTALPAPSAHYSGTTYSNGVQMNTNTLATSKPMQRNYGNQFSGHNMLPTQAVHYSGAQNVRMQQAPSNSQATMFQFPSELLALAYELEDINDEPLINTLQRADSHSGGGPGELSTMRWY